VSAYFGKEEEDYIADAGFDIERHRDLDDMGGVCVYFTQNIFYRMERKAYIECSVYLTGSWNGRGWRYPYGCRTTRTARR
jgi:hypothetical protein